MVNAHVATESEGRNVTDAFTNSGEFRDLNLWLTVRRFDFKQNCKYFQWDIRRIKEYASEIQNVFFSKS